MFRILEWTTFWIIQSECGFLKLFQKNSYLIGLHFLDRPCPTVLVGVWMSGELWTGLFNPWTSQDETNWLIFPSNLICLAWISQDNLLEPQKNHVTDHATIITWRKIWIVFILILFHGLIIFLYKFNIFWKTFQVKKKRDFEMIHQRRILNIFELVILRKFCNF